MNKEKAAESLQDEVTFVPLLKIIFKTA